MGKNFNTKRSKTVVYKNVRRREYKREERKEKH